MNRITLPSGIIYETDNREDAFYVLQQFMPKEKGETVSRSIAKASESADVTPRADEKTLQFLTLIRDKPGITSQAVAKAFGMGSARGIAGICSRAKKVLSSLLLVYEDVVIETRNYGMRFEPGPKLDLAIKELSV
jgi:hypothetical protein